MNSQRPYIAVVDDNLSIGKALTRLLRTAGHDAAAFTSGEDFLQSVSSHRPDCLVLDVHMSGMDGLQVRDRLGSMGCLIPIVFVTALNNELIQQRALDGEGTAFLQKPFNYQELLDAIDGIKSMDPRSQTPAVPPANHSLAKAGSRSLRPSTPRKADACLPRRRVVEMNRFVDKQQKMTPNEYRIQSALDEMGSRLIDSIELERGRIARELHDDLCQRLALLAIGIEQLAQAEKSSQDGFRSQVHQLWQDTADICYDAGRMSRELHSCKLERLGLVPATRSLCSDLSKQHGVRIEFTSRSIPENIPKEVALCLFRIAQEALGNAVKHSQAQAIYAELNACPEGLQLQIRDNGRGFDLASVSGKGRLGLTSMRERVRIVGGKISIQSHPSHGTKIDVCVPVSSGVSPSA